MEKIELEMNPDGRFRPAGGRKLEDYNPKDLLLVAMADCAGRTALMLMDKMKVAPVAFEICAKGVIDTDAVRAETSFTSFEVTYNVTCRSMDEQPRVSRALELTHDKHCGVVAMMRHIAPVERRILIHSVEPEKV